MDSGNQAAPPPYSGGPPQQGGPFAPPYGGPPPPYNPYGPQAGQAGYPPPGGYQMPPGQMGYPPPGGYQPPPGGYAPPPGGYAPLPAGFAPPPTSLYPDLSQLPQPQSVPTRPAPAPPGQPVVPGQPGQVPWWCSLRDGEAPPSCVISWKGGDGLKLYFFQQEGHIVSPKKEPLQLMVYKKIKTGQTASPVVEEDLLGMLEVMGCWRLRLHGKTKSFALHSLQSNQDFYVFLDESTTPRRFVVLELPSSVSKTMHNDLLALIHEMSDIREENEKAVDKISSNVETVYTDITKKLNTAVKEVVPGAHKSTKWLRKGTGNLVRLGGNLVNKGIHMVADHIPAGQEEQQPQEESPIHTELMNALMEFRKAVQEGKITQV